LGREKTSKQNAGSCEQGETHRDLPAYQQRANPCTAHSDCAHSFIIAKRRGEAYDRTTSGSGGAARGCTTIYSRLLTRIERTNYDVLSRRVELPACEKLWVIAKAAVGAR
jgi:hypothetical protein